MPKLLLKRLSVFVFVFFVVPSITISHDGENTIVVDALGSSLTTKINHPTMTLTSKDESNDDFFLKRRDILKISAAAAAAIGSAFVLAPAKIIATATASTATMATATATATAIIIEEENNTKLPFPGNQKNIGVLWRTIRGQAAEATPSTLNKLVHSELFGGGSDKVTSCSRKTSGLVCVSERHDDFEHHLVQLHVIQSIRKALDQRHPVVVAAAKSKSKSKSNTSTRTGFFSAPGAAGSKTTTTTTSNTYSSKAFAIGMECFQRKDQPFLDKFVHSGGSNPFSIVDTTYTINDLKRDVNWVRSYVTLSILI
jgi:hypothetical protein